MWRGQVPAASRSAMHGRPTAARHRSRRGFAQDRPRRVGPHVQTVSTLNLESAQITKTASPIAMNDQTGL